VDGTVTHAQGVRVFLEGARLVYRLSGTGTTGSTLRVYLEQYERDPARYGQSPSDALANIAAVASTSPTCPATSVGKHPRWWSNGPGEGITSAKSTDAFTKGPGRCHRSVSQVLDAEAHDQGNEFISGVDAMFPRIAMSLGNSTLVNGSDDPSVRRDRAGRLGAKLEG
jgi:hypothetical protein